MKDDLPPVRQRRAVLVTGAASGLGLATVRHLAANGYQVFAGVRVESSCHSVDWGSDAITPLHMDLTDSLSIEKSHGTIAGIFGERGLHALFNNAGITTAGPLEFQPVDAYKRIYDVNVFGHVAVTQRFLSLIRLGAGRILFIGAIGGITSYPFYSAYCSSKQAIEAITDSLRLELYPWKIPVSLIELGSTTTPIWDKADLLALPIDERVSIDPAETKRLYGESLDAFQKAMISQHRMCMPADKVAKSIGRILTKRHPKARYRLGVDAKVVGLISHLPDRLRDRVIIATGKFPKKSSA